MKKIGITMIELLVSISIIIIFFVLLSTSLIYFYRFPTFDIFKDASTYRTIFFELSKTLKEADEIKNIYNTSSVSAIYVQVEDSIYAYRINRVVSNRRLEKSVDRGYTWFFVPNTSNLQDIVFKAPVPYSQAKIVFVSLKTNYPNYKISKFHQFAVKIRKEKEKRYVIAGIVNSNINPNNNRVQYTLGGAANWQNFLNISNRFSPNFLNIDTFVTSSYNSIQPIRIQTDNRYQLWYFYKQNYNSSFGYTYLDTSGDFQRGSTDTIPGADRDWLKIVNVGNYLYTAYAVIEKLYNPSTGSWEDYYSVYFAYKKLVPNYWQNNVKSSWLKKRVYSIRRVDISGGDIKFVRFSYGNAAGNKFHITFCTVISQLQLNANNYPSDFYYLGSKDGKNWNSINIDKTLVSKNIIPIDKLNPLFVVPLVDTSNKRLHFVFVNWGNFNNQDIYRVAYLYTDDLSSFSAIEYLNTGSLPGPAYRNILNQPFGCEEIRDFDAIFYNDSIYIVVSGRFRSLSIPRLWNGPRDKIAILSKNISSGTTVYNLYPNHLDPTNITFSSCSLAIERNYIHIIGNNRNTFYYLRQLILIAMTVDMISSTFGNQNALCIDSFHDGNYLHFSFYDVNSGDLDYYRIFNPLNPSLAKIGSRSIDDNLVIPSNSIDGERLLGRDIVNGEMSGITRGSDGYLHFLTYCRDSSSLGEVIYIYPTNPSNPMPNANGFDTLLVHDSSSYYRSINCDVNDNGNFVVTYTDNSGNEGLPPQANNINDLKIYIDNFHTEIDGNRRFDTENNTNISGSLSCGFHNDVKIVNNTIYVAYFVLDGDILLLKFAKSYDKGETWILEEDYLSKTFVINNLSSNDISLQVKGNIINVVYRYYDFYLGVSKKENGYWNTYFPSDVPTGAFNIRTFLDKSNNLHILSFGDNQNPTEKVYYRVFRNDTNMFELFDGIDTLNLREKYITYGIQAMGPTGDILVEDDGTVYIVISTLRSNNLYGVDLLIRRNGIWQPPIRIPPSSPVNYLLNSLRINKW
ncbi:MAG: hypothetical protein RMJ51_01160 [Candidatus Calescibacterium sp.]|nr:hypothetical protein [Candidatus Calescibacterium sp.]MCX7972152.1 hypothetical protein [bacterium]MDW8194841.1 hypothetical protein [Candidatus Calescibacterium sp.]